MLRHVRALVLVLVTVLVVAASLALAGCTYVEPPTAPTGAPATLAPSSSSKSCSVLTVHEVSRALGQAVSPGVLGKATVEGGIACVYYGPSVAPGANPDVPVPDSVRVVLVTGSRAQPCYHDYLTNVAAQTVPGIGDDAFYDGTASVNVLKGDDYLRVSVIKSTGSDEAAEIGLAKVAVAGL
jgi:hypothetical protein